MYHNFFLFAKKIQKNIIPPLFILTSNIFENMDMSKMWELMKLQQEAMKIQKELENTIIEAEVDWLVVSVNGKMEVEKVDFETLDLIPGLSDSQKKALEEAIMKAYNKWAKKAQEVAASKMQWVMSQMWLNMPAWGLPGM